MHDDATQATHAGATPDAPPPSTEGAAFSEDGVDLTLIRWYLRLTPTERLQVLQALASFIWRVRRDNSPL